MGLLMHVTEIPCEVDNMIFKIVALAISISLAGIGIYAIIRNAAIDCIGELKYMKRESVKRREMLKEAQARKSAYEQTQQYMAEYVDLLKAEDECIAELEERIKKHWGWKILNPNKKYVSRFDFL